LGMITDDWLRESGTRKWHIRAVCHRSHGRWAFAERQVQGPRPVDAGSEAVMLVERLGGIVFCIDDECVRGDLFASLHSPLDSAAGQQSAKALASLINPAGEPIHAKTGDRIPRQTLAIGFGKLRRIDLRRAERVVTEYQGWRRRVHQHIALRNTAPPVLGRELGQIVVEDGNAAVELRAVVNGGIEAMFFKHAAQSRERVSAQPAMPCSARTPGRARR